MISERAERYPCNRFIKKKTLNFNERNELGHLTIISTAIDTVPTDLYNLHRTNINGRVVG